MAAAGGRRRLGGIRHLALGAAAVLVLAGCGAARPAAPAQPLSLAPCTVQGITAQCGTLSVPENRLTGKGRRIGLRVVVVPATNQPRQPDPFVYLAGGPGDMASEHVHDMVLLRSRHDRDLVFVDQRGVGGSNKLACAPAAASVDLSVPAQLATYLRTCLTGLSADPRFYTTAMAADDLADVLTALHYARANLYGGSYGATIAQVVERRHPQLVRTMTLLGGTLLDIPIFERMPRNSQAALDDVFARCRSDAACAARFPRLATEWRALLRDLARAPVKLPASRSPDGHAIVLTADAFAGTVHRLLLTADTAALLPALVHGLATATDRVAFVEQEAQRLAATLGSSSSSEDLLLMPIVVRCNELWARYSPEQVARLGAGSYSLGNTLADARSWQQQCSVMPAAGSAVGADEPVVSQTPVLIVNGGADPQDPPSNMAGAGRLWPRSRQLVEPHQGHSLSSWTCQESIVDAFLAQGSADNLDTGCLSSVEVPQIALS